MLLWSRSLAALAGVFGACGVALAAASAHLAAGALATTAASFLLVHATVLVGICAAAPPRGTRALNAAGSLIAAGVLLFSGEIAVHALLGVQPVPKAAPTGGILLIIGWLALAVALPGALKRRA